MSVLYAVLYAGQSRAGVNRTHGVYGIRTAYKPYGTFSTISYFYGQPYGTIPYGMVITAVRTVRFILLATLLSHTRILELRFVS
jgi:hypothetical protein